MANCFAPQPALTVPHLHSGSMQFPVAGSWLRLYFSFVLYSPIVGVDAQLVSDYNMFD